MSVDITTKVKTFIEKKIAVRVTIYLFKQVGDI